MIKLFKSYWLWFGVFGGLLLILALVVGDFYLFLKLLVWFVVAISIGLVGREWVMGFLVVAALVNGLVGLGQVIKQHDLGLYFLGESRLEVTDKKVALAYLGNGHLPIPLPNKGGGVENEDIFLLRAYGLTPHPNVLGGLIFLGIMATFYFLIKQSFRAKFLWVVWIILWVSLVLTFSRSAYLATVVGILFVYFNLERFRLGEMKKDFKKTFVVTAAFIFIFLGWALVPRINTLNVNNFAVTERVSSFEVFASNFSNYGFLGEGLSLKIKEPLYHNFYLMMLKEGGMVLLLVFLTLVYLLFKERLKSKDFRFIIPLAMVLGLLIIGVFDHYLWTIRQGVGMLFLSLGLLI